MIVFLAYAIVSRLAYVLYVGFALRREELYGPSGDFRRFRHRASFVMYNDAVAFVALCLATRDTVRLPMPLAASIALGAALAIIGLGTKLWAAQTLGSDAYYWQNFFEPELAGEPVSSGPYRFASAFAQVAILTFYLVVEKPHFERLHRSS